MACFLGWTFTLGFSGFEYTFECLVIWIVYSTVIFYYYEACDLWFCA